jgi:hypothetical protein
VLLAALLAAAAPAACGYGFVRPEGVAAVRVGAIDDFSAEGDLGSVVRRRVRLAVREPGDGAPVLDGTVRVLDDAPAAFQNGFAAMYEQPVEVELRLADADGRPLWTSGPRRRRAVFARGATPLETESARRAALSDAARAATDDALAALSRNLPKEPNP